MVSPVVGAAAAAVAEAAGKRMKVKCLGVVLE